ncbi:MAG: 2-isopropylmalate synthase [Eubacteriales bacterium]|nr:2-isopropylmalate synthase [Eubacteriales bacterium]
MLNYQRYKAAPVLSFPERTWPDRTIEHAPVWCSVDLRDGNQALVTPMNVEEKIEFFLMLVKLGFKEIEVGFPAASQVEYDFVRQLVTRRLIPDDVYIQVITQCREEQIRKTFDAITGIDKVIFNIYNSISTLQRDVVFHKDQGAVKHIALRAARQVQALRWEEEFPGEFVFEYTAESFTGADMKFALDVCESVKEIWQPSEHNRMIINLPATVEQHTPNVYADMVEWMHTHLSDRDKFTLSIHPHNDRGTGVAATELALLAGAERVEGTLFGNGERTGNADILTTAYNMFAQGINPGLDLENEPEIQEVYERCTKMPVPDRYPYAGKLVFTAFSGSHQDAINKGIHMMQKENKETWEVPYLPIDPADIGRTYEPIVRINSQSGKGGVAFVLESFYGYRLPKAMHREFADIIQRISETRGEIQPAEVYEAFVENYIEAKEPIRFDSIGIIDTAFDHGERQTLVDLSFLDHGKTVKTRGLGTGPLDAAQLALEEELHVQMRIMDYSEHSLTSGSSADAVAYVQLLDQESGRIAFGVGRSSNTMKASIRGLFSAVNRLYFLGKQEKKEVKGASDGKTL